MTDTPGGNGAASNRFERRPILTISVITIILLLIADIAVGQLIAARDMRVILKGYGIERTYRKRSARLHHELLPSFSTDSAFWGGRFYPLRTNSLGFKDFTTRTIDSSAAEPRVLLIGDSFTEGIGIPYAETFAGLLASRMRGVGVDVLNAGVASYAPIIYARRIEDLIGRRGVRVDEVVVFVDISDVQDETNYFVDSLGNLHSRSPVGSTGPRVTREELFNLTPRSGWRARLLAELRANRSLTHQLLYLAKKRIINADFKSPGCNPPVTEGDLSCRGGWTSSEAVMALYGRRGLDSASAHMSELATVLRSKNIPLTVVVYPWPMQLRWNDRASLQVSHWRNWSRANGARVVELFSDFFAAADSVGLDRVVERYFIPGDVHWNAAGHAFIEERFLYQYCQGAAVDSGDVRTLVRAHCRRSPTQKSIGTALPGASPTR